MRTFIRWSGASLVSAGLLACGGGGGTAPPAGPTANITSTDYAASGDSASNATLSGLASLAVLDAGATAGVQSSNSRAEAFNASVQRLSMQKLVARAKSPTAQRAQALAVSTSSTPCDSGSLLFTFNEASFDTGTPGDTIHISSQNCVMVGEPVAGSLLATLTSFTSSATSESGGLTFVFSNFGVPGLSLNGNANVTFAFEPSTTTVTLVNQGLAVTVDNAAPVQWFHTVSFVANAAGSSISLSGLAGVSGGTVQFDQLTPFTLSMGQPSSGVLQLTGANGARVKIVAGAANFSYEYFAAGNSSSTPDATSAGLAFWRLAQAG